jgi:hypothetical protein
MEEFEGRHETQPELIEIQLGTAQQIFNSHDTIEYYLFALNDHIDTLTFLLVALDRNHIIEQFKSCGTSTKNRKKQNKEHNNLLFNMEVWKVKGPPYSYVKL